MTKGRINPQVDPFFRKATKWRAEFEKLRRIILESQLTEELKWGVPCYTIEGKNVVLIHGFKDYCAILFFKGALLKDSKKILIQQTKNVQAARQARFTSGQEIDELKAILKGYIGEAIEAEKNGLKVSLKKTREYKIPEEFQKQLEENPGLKRAFAALTPGRQRAYILYFSAPKQSKTRQSRIENHIQQIFDGLGLND